MPCRQPTTGINNLYLEQRWLGGDGGARAIFRALGGPGLPLGENGHVPFLWPGAENSISCLDTLSVRRNASAIAQCTRVGGGVFFSPVLCVGGNRWRAK